jgi:hypothetical protein
VQAPSAELQQPPAKAETDAAGEEDDGDQGDLEPNHLSDVDMFKMANNCVSVLAELNRVALSSSIKPNMSTVYRCCRSRLFAHIVFAARGF